MYDNKVTYTAYLIVMCDKETNAILGAAIWSSPEWEQSRRLDLCYTYIAYMTKSHISFQDASDNMVEWLTNNHEKYGDDRYYRLLKYIKKESK